MTLLSPKVRLFFFYYFVFLPSFCYFCSVCLSLSSPLCSDDKVETFPVLKIDPKDIVDTNGAGDAFVGGKIFLFFFLWYISELLVGCLCFLWIPVQVVPLWCRFPVWARPRETTWSVREGSTLRRQRHHQTSRLHLPRKTRVQLRKRGQLFPKPETLYSSCRTQPWLMISTICFTNTTFNSCSPIFYFSISYPSMPSIHSS